MDTWFTFFLHSQSSEASALEELSSCALAHPSFEEDLVTGDRKIYAVAAEHLFPPHFRHIASYKKLDSCEINWDQEWSLFSPYFQEGFAKIPLSDFSSSLKEVKLLPGPGFGDLSHPTTHLSLELLSLHAKKQIIIDLGCGSGILGLAALQWEATFVYALDIDPNALKHTEENARLNHLENLLVTAASLAQKPDKEPTLLVMNMTFEEQKIALTSLPQKPLVWITSGILKEQEKKYLHWAKKQGMLLESISQKEKWIACVFTKCSQPQ